MVKGRVYVLVNPSHPYLKIGCTSRTAQERAQELNSKTGLPADFIVAYEHEVADYKWAESVVHEVLKNGRVSSNREFFKVEMQEAIDTIRRVIKKQEDQLQLDWADGIEPHKAPMEFWNIIPAYWKPIFARHVDLAFEPEESDLLDGLHHIIYYSRSETLRETTCAFIQKKDFNTRILSWYETQAVEVQHEIRAHLPQSVGQLELEAITSLTKLDCSGNLLLKELYPLKLLPNLNTLDLSSTAIIEVSEIAELSSLAEINCNHTQVSSLESFEGLENLTKIHCYQTELTKAEKERFREAKPQVELVEQYF